MAQIVLTILVYAALALIVANGCRPHRTAAHLTLHRYSCRHRHRRRHPRPPHRRGWHRGQDPLVESATIARQEKP